MPDLNDIILAIIAIVPTTATVITAAWQGRKSRRDAAKQNIRILILHDRVMYDQAGTLPRHYEQIMSEYQTYHTSGGNGVVTAEVNDYQAWVNGLNVKNSTANFI